MIRFEFRVLRIVGAAVAAALLSISPAAAVVAPSGTIVFASYQPGTYGRNGASDLFSVRPDGTGLTNLTATADRDEEQPAITRDGSRMVFRGVDLPFRVSGFELFTSDANGGNVTRITSNDWADESPTWTPDGKQVVFSSNRNDTNHGCLVPPCRLDLYSVMADGSQLRQLTDIPGGVVNFPSVSSDGRTILFTFLNDAGDTALFTVRLDGTGLRQLTQFAQESFHAHWSPNGARIAFSDNGCITCAGSSIWTMRADGTDARRLTTGKKGTNDYNAQWSPDGEWLTFTRQATGSFTSSDIYRITATGTQQTLILERGVNFESTWGR
jgi:Tol biopolymer transport system component